MKGVEISVDIICAILTNFRADVAWHHDETTNSYARYHTIIERAQAIIRDAAHMADRLGLPPSGVGVGGLGLVDTEPSATTRRRPFVGA